MLAHSLEKETPVLVGDFSALYDRFLRDVRHDSLLDSLLNKSSKILQGFKEYVSIVH